MNNAIFTFFRFAYRTYFSSRGTPARLTVKRFFVMSIFLPVFFILQISHFLGLALDSLLFRGYRDIQIKEPLFIIGIPRSGTTLLHRALAADTKRATTFTLWELVLAPSIAEKKFWIGLAKFHHWLGSPLSKIMPLGRRIFIHHLEAIHKISLTDPEEDFLILAPIFACFLLILPFPFEEIWRLAYFDEQTTNLNKARVLPFYKACIQRHLYYWGKDKRVVSKNASFIPFIKYIKETFPDCKIIYTIRDPLMVVPSLLSSMQYGARIFDNDTSDPFFRDPFVGMLKHFYKLLINQLQGPPANSSILFLSEELEKNLEDVVIKTYHHFGYALSDAFLHYIQVESKRARQYKSNHHYCLEQFGLEREAILSDFKFTKDFFTAFRPALKK